MAKLIPEKVLFFLPTGGTILFEIGEKDVEDITVEANGDITVKTNDGGDVLIRGLPYTFTRIKNKPIDKDSLTKPTNDNKK